MENDIVISLDLEFAQPSNKIIQIGIVAGNPFTGEIVNTLSIIVNPEELLSNFIINLTGITQEQVNNGITIEEAYERVYSFIKNLPIARVSAITWGGGDIQCLREQTENIAILQSKPFPFGRRFTDVKTLCCTYLIANKRNPAGGLKKSMAKFGLNFEGIPHDALYDALNTFRFYVLLLSKLKTQ